MNFFHIKFDTLFEGRKICKIDKSFLIYVLEENIYSFPPDNYEMVALERFFMLHSIKDVPVTYLKSFCKWLEGFMLQELMLSFTSVFKITHWSLVEG